MSSGGKSWRNASGSWANPEVSVSSVSNMKGLRTSEAATEAVATPTKRIRSRNFRKPETSLGLNVPSKEKTLRSYFRNTDYQSTRKQFFWKWDNSCVFQITQGILSSLWSTKLTACMHIHTIQKWSLSAHSCNWGGRPWDDEAERPRLGSQLYLFQQYDC